MMIRLAKHLVRSSTVSYAVRLSGTANTHNTSAPTQHVPAVVPRSSVAVATATPIASTIAVSVAQHPVAPCPDAIVRILSLSASAPPEAVQSAASDVLAVLRDCTVEQLALIVGVLHRHQLRHERLLLDAAWRILKAELPSPTEQPGNTLLVSTAVVFHALSDMRMLCDEQLVGLALGRCAELISFMSPASVADVVAAVSKLDRHYCSWSDIAAGSSELATPTTLQEPMVGSRPEAPCQPNLVEQLCDLAEQRMQAVCEHLSASSAASFLCGLSKLGVRFDATLECLARRCACLSFSPSHISELLRTLPGLHRRVLDPLEHDPSVMPGIPPLLCAVVSSSLQWNIVQVARENPKTIVALRQFCEKCVSTYPSYPPMSVLVSQVWERIRCLRMKRSQLRETNHQPKRLLGKLGAARYRVKLKPVIPDPNSFQKIPRRLDFAAGRVAPRPRRSNVAHGWLSPRIAFGRRKSHENRFQRFR